MSTLLAIGNKSWRAIVADSVLGDGQKQVRVLPSGWLVGIGCAILISNAFGEIREFHPYSVAQDLEIRWKRLRSTATHEILPTLKEGFAFYVQPGPDRFALHLLSFRRGRVSESDYTYLYTGLAGDSTDEAWHEFSERWHAADEPRSRLAALGRFFAAPRRGGVPGPEEILILMVNKERAVQTQGPVGLFIDGAAEEIQARWIPVAWPNLSAPKGA